MNSTNPILLILFGLLFITTSCRTEDDLFIDTPAEEALISNSNAASLIRNVATNDGSFDNIIDYASCISVNFPITVTVNGNVIVLEDEDDIDLIEDIFDEFEDDVDELEITFPILITLPNHTIVEINSEDELDDFLDLCEDEDAFDDDIECIDFQYPISVSLFNENNDVIETISIMNDRDMYRLVENLDDYTAVSIVFPITMILWDGTLLTIDSIQELVIAIEAAADSCDEDDDFDFDDDDCNDCTTDLLSDFITACDGWYIDDLERNDNDLEERFDGYRIRFNADNTLVLSWNNNSINGTWTANGSGNNISFVLEIPGFDELNGSWHVHELESYDGEKEISLRMNNDDELELRNDNCN